jgi:hypothetical protein
LQTVVTTALLSILLSTGFDRNCGMLQALQGGRQVNVVARDIAGSKNLAEARAKAWVAWKSVDSAPWAAALGRWLVMAYFLNLVCEDFERYRFLNSAEMQVPQIPAGT